MQTFFPSRQDVEDDDAIDYVILGELFMHYVCLYPVPNTRIPGGPKSKHAVSFITS